MSSTSVSISLPACASVESLPATRNAKHNPPVKRNMTDLGVAAICVQRAWRCHRNRKRFKLLIYAVRAAAATDACKLMGHRAYYEQVVCDHLDYQKNKVTDVLDVATFKDYMQYISHLDETPAHLGGRDNCWRRLSLKNMPRTTILYDIVDYAESGTLSDRLKEEINLLLQIPRNENIQRRQLRALTQYRSPAPPPSSPISTYLSSYYSTTPRNVSRRSHKVRLKVEKMRKLYGIGKEQVLTDDSTRISQKLLPDKKNALYPGVFSDDDWEEEAEKLYAWSQSLSIEETERISPILYKL